MKILGITSKGNNKRVTVAKQSDDLYRFQFKKLIKKSEIENYKENPTCEMIIEKTIVITEFGLSQEAALRLLDVLIKTFKKEIKKG